MLRLFLSASLLVILSVTAVAGDDGPPPGLPPRITTMTRDREGNPVLHKQEVRYVQEVREQKVMVNGQVQTRQITVTVPVFQEVLVSLPKGVKVYGTDGKQISLKDLKKGLKGDTPVIVSSDGQMVSPFYRRILREGTFIVVLPQARPVPVPGNPMPPGPKQIPRP